jgi:UTP--glucose-1-phosphate uridylyltransferase
MDVDVAVIPAAGLGTRMRPATRVLPKALLPIVDRPAAQYAVEEAARAGAHEVIFVVDIGVGSMIYEHFTGDDPLPGLEHVKIRVAVQEEPQGLGHAVWTAQEKVRDRPFFCLLADDIVPPGGDVLTDMAAAAGDDESVVCLWEMPEDLLAHKGVADPGEWRSERVVQVRGAVEKPGPEKAPSRLGFVGRYLFTPDVFSVLAGLDPGHGGEIQLTDAIAQMAREGKVLGFVSDHDLLDVGMPGRLLEASTILGLASDHGDVYRSFLKDLVNRL